jgi:hypothetical protein
MGGACPESLADEGADANDILRPELARIESARRPADKRPAKKKGRRPKSCAGR